MTLQGQWPEFGDEEIESVRRVLASGQVNYWTGSECKAFEEEFAKACDARFAIALSNGTVALELALEAAGIGQGDDVIVTPRTFIASASCVVRLGGRPVFADIDADSQNITPDSVRAALTAQTRAVILVHHAGWPCDMDGFAKLAAEHDLVIIEDCAQAHGASINGKPVGGLGHIAAFSFCQDKIMTTGGEGGMLVTNDESIWKRAWAIKDHGKNFDSVFAKNHKPGFRWLHDSFGTNMRMTEMQAAIGRVQLKKLPEWHEQRNHNAAHLTNAMRDHGCIRVPEPTKNVVHAYYRLYAFVEPDGLSSGWDRDRIAKAIQDNGVPCFSGSCPEIYNEQAFESARLRPANPMPVAKSLEPLSLAFLVHPTLSKADLNHMAKVLDEVLSMASARTGASKLRA